MTGMRVLTLRDEAVWSGELERFPRKDLAHSPRFSRIYEDAGIGTAECFLYEEGDRRVLYPYIRRPLDRLPFLPPSLAGRCDTVTPYCYGGFVHDAPDDEAPDLLHRFRQAFSAHCRDSGVVSEFVRFHPMLQNQRFAEGCCDRLFLHQPNIVIDLARDEEDLLRQCRPTFRRYIRRAAEHGWTVGIDASGAAAPATFARMYAATMRRHDQTGFLNFQPLYFDALFRQLQDDLLLFTVTRDGHVAAAAIVLVFGDYLDYFLGASDAALLDEHPNHLLFHEIALWGHRQGYRWLHLGGGRPSLVYFKSGFSDTTVPYFIAQHIHDAEAYEAATHARRSALPPLPAGPSRFFPAYREGLE